jgi:hypothetical protein
MFRKSYGSVGTLATPLILYVRQNQNNYRIGVTVGNLQSFFPITYEIFADGVSIATGTLASSSPALTDFGTIEYDVGTYTEGKEITYTVTTLSQSKTSIGMTASYVRFSGSFSGITFDPVGANAYTDPSEGTKYSWRIYIDNLIVDAGYYNPVISYFFEWDTVAGTTYPNTQTINSSWVGHPGGTFTEGSVGNEGGALSKLSPHTVSGGNKFRFHVTVSVAGYSQTYDYTVFTNV